MTAPKTPLIHSPDSDEEIDIGQDLWSGIQERAQKMQFICRITAYLMCGLTGVAYSILICTICLAPLMPSIGALYVAVGMVAIGIGTASLSYAAYVLYKAHAATWYAIVKMSPADGRAYARWVVDTHGHTLTYAELDGIMTQEWKTVFI